MTWIFGGQKGEKITVWIRGVMLPTSLILQFLHPVGLGMRHTLENDDEGHGHWRRGKKGAGSGAAAKAEGRENARKRIQLRILVTYSCFLSLLRYF